MYIRQTEVGWGGTGGGTGWWKLTNAICSRSYICIELALKYIKLRLLVVCVWVCVDEYMVMPITLICIPLNSHINLPLAGTTRLCFSWTTTHINCQTHFGKQEAGSSPYNTVFMAINSTHSNHPTSSMSSHTWNYAHQWWCMWVNYVCEAMHVSRNALFSCTGRLADLMVKVWDMR